MVFLFETKGKMTYANGETYKGIWKENKKDGNGIYD